MCIRSLHPLSGIRYGPLGSAPQRRLSQGSGTIPRRSGRTGAHRRPRSTPEAEMAQSSPDELLKMGCLWSRLILAIVVGLIFLIAVLVTFPILILIFLMIPFLILFL